MAVKSSTWLFKACISLIFVCSNITTAYADDLTTRLIYIAPNKTIDTFEQFTKSEQDKWLKQHISLDSSQPQIAYLLAAKHLYLTKQYQQANTQIDILLSLIQDRPASLLLANTLYIKAYNTSLGLRKFEQSQAIFAQTIEVINQLNSADNNQRVTALAIAANYRLGSLYLFLKQPANAKLNLEKSIDNAKKINNKQYLITPMLELAKYYMAIGEKILAEQQLIKSYDVASQINSNQTPYILKQFSRFYRQHQQYDLAIDYARKAVKYYANNADKTHELAGAYNNLAVAYEESGDHNTAVVHYLNTVKLLESNPHNYFLALATHNIGLIYFQQAKLDQAFTYLHQANTHFKTMGHSYYLMMNQLSLAQLLLEKNEFNQTIQYAQQALALAIKQRNSDSEFEALNYLSNAYLNTQQFQESAAAFKSWSSMLQERITTLQEQLDAKISPTTSPRADLHTQIADYKNQLNQQVLINTAQTQKLSLMSGFLSLAILLLVVILLFLIHTKKKKHQLQTSVNTAGNTQLLTLHDEQVLLNIVNNEFIGQKFIFTIKIPLLNQLINIMGLEQANHFKAKITHDLSRFIGQSFYQISEDTFAFANPLNQSQTIESHFLKLLECYQALIPKQLHQLPQAKVLLLGGVEGFCQHSKVNLIQAKNLINLSLTALSAIGDNQSDSAQQNWLLLRQKPGHTTDFLTSSTRQEWLHLAANNMLLLQTGIKQPINWLDIPHFSKED